MTILDACVEAYKWFEKNDYFEIERDFKKVILITESEEEDKACLLCALDKLVEQKAVSKGWVDGRGIYILNKSLESVEQEIKIDTETALKVSEVINRFCDEIKDHKDVCDPSKITNKDVFNIALILESYQNQNDLD